MKPALASLREGILVVVAVVAVTLAVAEAVPLTKVAVTTAVTAAATSAVAHVLPTQASHDKTQVTALVMAKVMAPRHAASAAHKRRARRVTASHACRAMKSSAKTHAVRVLTWATSPITSTNASPPVMYQQAFRHRACPRAAVVVADGVVIVAVAVAVAVAETLAAAAHDLAAVAVVILAAVFGADRSLA